MVHMARAYLTEKQMPCSAFGSTPSLMLHLWWTQFRVNSKIALPHPSFWFMGLAIMSAPGNLYSLHAIFIMRRMVISPAWNIKPTQWTVLSLGGRQHPMRSSSTTRKIFNITNLTPIALIPTSFLAWCILIWNMTVASFACYYLMKIPALRKNTLLGPVLSALTWPLICLLHVSDGYSIS